MLNLIFGILMIAIFGKLFLFAIKATWGLAKIICTVVLLPLFLVALVLQGLFIIALPILLVVGLLALLVFHD